MESEIILLSTSSSTSTSNLVRNSSGERSSNKGNKKHQRNLTENKFNDILKDYLPGTN